MSFHILYFAKKKEEEVILAIRKSKTKLTCVKKIVHEFSGVVAVLVLDL
jgi:hypothetical protein